jgi:hydrogenase nickel incorporation protein HypA/HybF
MSGHMHELAVTESILEIALRHAQGQAAKKITCLHIVLGEWSSIVDDSVQFYWDIISAGTIAQGARLDFRRIPARLACSQCNTEYSPNSELLECPVCGSTNVRILTGDEFQLEAIDIE